MFRATGAMEATPPPMALAKGFPPSELALLNPLHPKSNDKCLAYFGLPGAESAFVCFINRF